MDQPGQFQQPQPTQPSVEPQLSVQAPAPPEEGQIPTTSIQPGGSQKPSRKILLLVLFITIILIGLGALGYFLLKRTDSESGEPMPTSETVSAPSPVPAIETSHYLGSQTITLRDVTGGGLIGNGE